MIPDDRFGVFSKMVLFRFIATCTGEAEIFIFQQEQETGAVRILKRQREHRLIRSLRKASVSSIARIPQDKQAQAPSSVRVVALLRLFVGVVVRTNHQPRTSSCVNSLCPSRSTAVECPPFLSYSSVSDRLRGRKTVLPCPSLLSNVLLLLSTYRASPPTNPPANRQPTTSNREPVNCDPRPCRRIKQTKPNQTVNQQKNTQKE